MVLQEIPGCHNSIYIVRHEVINRSLSTLRFLVWNNHLCLLVCRNNLHWETMDVYESNGVILKCFPRFRRN